MIHGAAIEARAALIDSQPVRKARVGRRDPGVLVFALLLAAAFAVRAFFLVSDGAPVGIDGGNWLAYGNALLGHSTRTSTIVYPPFVPLVVTAAVGLLGLTAGLAAVGALSAVAIPLVVFIIVRSTPAAPLAPVLAGALLLAPGSGEMAAWGGYPQLLGTAFGLAFLWLLATWVRGGTRSHLVWSAAMGAAVLATSHAAAAVAAAGAIALIILLLRSEGLAAVTRGAAAAAAVAFASLPLLGVYVHLVPALVSSAGHRAVTSVAVTETPARFADIHGAAWPLWLVGLIIAAAVAIAPARSQLGLISAALLAGLSALLLLTHESRVLFEVPVVGVLAAAAVLAERDRLRRGGFRTLSMCLVVATLLVATVAGIAAAPGQRARFAVVDRGLIESLLWLRQETPPETTVAVNQVTDAPLGWWVEGVARRRSIYAAPLRWLTFPDERARADLGNTLFHRLGVPTEEGMRRAEELGVDYVMIAKRLPAYREDLLDAWPTPAVFENESAVVFAVSQQDHDDTAVEGADR